MADRIRQLTQDVDKLSVSRMSSPVKKRPNLPLMPARPNRVKREPPLNVSKISILANHYPVSAIKQLEFWVILVFFVSQLKLIC